MTSDEWRAKDETAGRSQSEKTGPQLGGPADAGLLAPRCSARKRAQKRTRTDEGDLADTERTPRDIREMEAEAVSLLCCESLGLPGAEYSRGYIQSWGRGQTFTERSAQRIFHAADQILRAGYPGK